MRTIKDLLKDGYPFWDKLTPQEQNLLTENSTIESYKKNTFIHSRRGDCLGVFLVISGQARIYLQSDEGREVTLFRVDPGEICTLSASCVMEEITFDTYVDAAQDTELLITHVSCIHKLLEHSIYVENFIYRQTAQHFSDVIWAMSQILFSSFDKRLAAYLEDQRIQAGSLVIPTTHSAIAKDLGSAREVVSRMLKYFEREGIVALSRGCVTIASPERLKALARESS